MQTLVDLFPPETGKESLPKWYSKLSKDDSQPTVRHCSGFQDLYKNSIIIRSWSDFSIDVFPDNSINYNFACGNHLQYPLERHHIETQATDAWPGYANIKLMSPWYFKTNKMCKWLMIPPIWDQPDPLEFTIVSGVLEFKYQHETNINCLLKLKSQPYTINVKSGQVLVQLIPLFDEPWNMKVETFDQRDWNKNFGKWNHAFNYSYQKTRSILEKRNK